MIKPLGLSAFYYTFREIIGLIHACTKVEDIAELVVFKITRAFDAQGALLQLVNRGTGEVAVNVAYGLSQFQQAPGPLADLQTVITICQQKKVLVIDDILTETRLHWPQKDWAPGAQMLLVAPLGLGEDLAGIVLLAFAEKKDFSEEEIDFLAAVTQQSICAIDKARLIEKQQVQFDRLANQTERITALGRMAAGVAHEINNPLSSILLFSSNMKKKVPPDGFLYEGLDIIIQETKRCKTIIQELQEFSRSKEPKKTVGNINLILKKVINLLDSELRRNHISLHQDLAHNLPDMWVDVGQMQQVFANLLLNAIEAMNNKGKISLSTRFDPATKSIDIEIVDTGAGIPKEYQPRIFEPFFSTKTKGTGLGLAVTYGFIMNHQGDIQVASEPGQGTHFSIHLPVSLPDLEPARIN
jgi:two-component system, NtrC family, sensor kinase